MDFFLRSTYRISNARLSPFISADFGLRKNNYDGIGSAYDFVSVNNGVIKIDAPTSTYFIAPALGFSLRTSNNSYLELKVGYDYTPSIKEQDFEGDIISGGTGSSIGRWETHYDKSNLSSFYVSIGFTHTLKWFGVKNPPRHEINYIYNQQAIDELLLNNSVKAMFEQACEMPDENGQSKYDLLMKVAYADRYNEMGYQAAAFNNIGVMLYNRSDYKNAKLYLEQALIANPQYTEAVNNLSIVKSAISEKRWNNVMNALSVVGVSATTLGTIKSTQGGSVESDSNNYESTGSDYRRNSSSSSKSTQKNNHANWKALDRAYEGYENQLRNMQSSGNINEQEVKNIQQKMREIRKKIKEQSGHNRAISSFESWNP